MAETHGLKIYDASGNVCVITPDMGTVISMGRVTMPSGLVDTNKYYASIDLPGTDPIAVADLTVLATPVKWHSTSSSIYPGAPFGYYHYATAYLGIYPARDTYYTKNESTGVMSLFIAGDLTVGDSTEWDAALNAYPLVYWELLGATTVTDIKIFAATCYIHSVSPDNSYPVIYSPSNDFVYSIYTQGVETIDYIIINKKWNY